MIGGAARTVTYSYDADGNRASIIYPSPTPYTFTYTYNGRNQLKTVDGWATYTYDENNCNGNCTGDLTKRTLASGPYTTYGYDALDRVTAITHTLNGAVRTFSYGYDAVGNRKWTTRDGNIGDVFRYDFNDQVNGVWLNVSNPSGTPTPSPNITYDANGNRTSFLGDTYTINDLNEYTYRNNTSAGYSVNGNLNAGVDGSTYVYDQQNRLLTANKNGTTDTFTYDGLNRQVSRAVTGQPTTYNVYDGWDLIEEYQAANQGAATASYLYGAGRLIGGGVNGYFNYYFQDGSGSTSNVTDEKGILREWYLYDLQGTPFIYDGNSNQLSGSSRSVRHLLTGQQWYADVGLYDLRNRFYSPDLGRFLQPDPLGFDRDTTNLYRYCGNNPLKWRDPSGTIAVPDQRGWYTYQANPGMLNMTGYFIYNLNDDWSRQCATGAQFMAGWMVNGAYHDMPSTTTWYQGASVTSATPQGTVIATGWNEEGRYPNASSGNHVGIFEGFDEDGNMILYDQYAKKPLGKDTAYQDPSGWYEVYVDKDEGRYDPRTSESWPGWPGSYSGGGGWPLGMGGMSLDTPITQRAILSSINPYIQIMMVGSPTMGWDVYVDIFPTKPKDL